MRRLAWLPIPVLLAAMLVFRAAGLQDIHESFHLLLTLNLVFSTLVCLFVAYLAARSFLVRGTPGLLLLGCGVVIWGPAGVVATAAARDDANISITIYNSCVWLSGLCHLAGVSLSLRPRRSLSPSALWLPAAYALAVGAIMLVTLAALAGWIPAFFVQGRGGTPMRQVVLVSAVAMFSLTALLLSATSRRTVSAFAYWYALALLLIAAGLFGVMLQTYHASVLGWTGRATQALGGLYMFTAAVASVRESRVWGISLEAALQEERDFTAAMLDTAGVLVVVLDAQGRITRFNRACERLTGYRAGDVLGRTLREFLVLPDEMEEVQETWRALDTWGVPNRHENHWLTRDGTRRLIDWSNTGLTDRAGELRHILAVGIDITERERTEEQLAYQANLLAIANDAVIALDPGRRVTYWNPAAEWMYGWTAAEALGARFEEVVQPVDTPEDVAARQIRFEQGDAIRGEYTHHRRDGAPFWVESTALAFFDEDTRVAGHVTVIRDITERKRTEEALKVKDSAIASSLSAIAMADLQGNLTYVNPAFLKLWGYKEREVLGRPVLDFWKEPQRALEVVQAIRNGGGWVGELVAARQDGVCLSLYISASTVLNDAGTPICMMASFIDITEHRRAEEALKQALLDAQQRYAETLALMTCTRAVLEYRDLVPTARTVFDACRGLLGAPASYVAVLTPDGAYNKLLFLEPGGLSCTVDPSLPMPVCGFRALAQRLGRVVYDNQFADSLWAELLPPGHVRLESVLFAPLVIDGDALGLLGLGNKPGGFTDHDATLAATFGELLAIVLRNSRMLESLRELNTTLESKVAERTAELSQRAKQLQKLTLELSQAEEHERRRIALILHEDLQQQIAGAKFHLNLLRNRTRHEPVQQAIAVKIDEILKGAIEKARSLSHELSPTVLHMNDLAEALRWLANDVRDKHGLTVHVDISGAAMLPSEALGMFLFRATQEMLFNAVKHARVHEAGIRVRRMGRYLYLSVSDRGNGFDPRELKQTSGFGLLSIRERVELLGGRMRIKSVKGNGSRFHIVVPDGRSS